MRFLKPHIFKGGVHPDGCKGATAQSPIRKVGMPKVLSVSMAQHLGSPAKPVVAVGQEVVKGQVIGDPAGAFSLPVHAPACGRVVAIEPRLLPNGRESLAVVVETVDSGEAVSLPPLDWRGAPKEVLLARLAETGLVGLGGAGFPVKIKLSPPPAKPIDTLLVNGAECEPFLTGDHRLMVERAFDLVTGIRISRAVLGGPAVRVCIEENKPDAIEAVSRELERLEGDVALVPLPVRYPQGSEKQQIWSATGRKVPRGGLPMDVGCVVENVATLCSIFDAVVKGLPLTERVVTVAGDSLVSAGNFVAPIGTPFNVLLEAAGIKESPLKVISGGPMMGFAVADTAVATTKTVSGVLALGRSPLSTSEPCISCGRCVEACPMRLSPAEMSQCIEADDLEGAKELGVRDCFECGCCAWSCPAHRPLVQHFRRAKTGLAALASKSAQTKK